MLQRNTLSEASISAQHPIALIMTLRRMIDEGNFPTNPKSTQALRLRAITPHLYSYFFCDLEPIHYAYLSSTVPFLNPTLFKANETQLSNALWLLLFSVSENIDPLTHDFILTCYWQTILSTIDIRNVYVNPNRLYESISNITDVASDPRSKLIYTIDTYFPEPLRSAAFTRIVPVIPRYADHRQISISQNFSSLDLPQHLTQGNFDAKIMASLHYCFYPLDDTPTSSDPLPRSGSPENDDNL